MKRLIRAIKRSYTKKPNTPIEWTPEAFQSAKKWAMAQEDPKGSGKSLWDSIYSPRKDSVEIIEEINQMINVI